MKANLRPSSLEEIRSLRLIAGIDWDRVMSKDFKPPFTPPVFVILLLMIIDLLVCVHIIMSGVLDREVI